MAVHLGQEALDLGTDLIGVGQWGTAALLSSVGVPGDTRVVLGLQRSEKWSELLGLLGLSVDLGLGPSGGFLEHVRADHESGGTGQRPQQCDGCSRILELNEVVRNVNRETQRVPAFLTES